jgi:hypothetical protein
MIRPRAFVLLLGLSSPAAAQAPALAGTYTAGPLAIAFEADTVRISRAGQIGVIGRFEVKGDTATFHDVAGPIACNPAISGRYLWKIEGANLSFTLVDDACPGRAGAFPGRTWTRQTTDSRAFTGLTLVDGTGSPPRSGMTILIGDGRITDVFPDGFKPIPATVPTMDLRGKFVIPGLIDTHVHLATNPSSEDARSRVEPRLRRTLLGGVTSVRDMAGDARALADLSRATKVGDLPGPTIYYSALFAGPGFFADPRVIASSRGEPVGQAPWARAITASTDLRQVIAEARGTGATGIKLYADIGADLLAPLVVEAHRQGMVVWGHAALFPARPHHLVNAGVDVLSHAPLIARDADTVTSLYGERYRVNYANVPVTHPMVDRLIGDMLARKTIVEPTLFVYFNRDSTSPPARWSAAITRELYRRGVPIAAGTDGIIGAEGDTLPSGLVLPHLHDELELLVKQGGLSPNAAIMAATSTAARAIGVDSLVGTVMPGKMADLVVLTADPLSDIRNTRAIEFVVRRGKIYR